VKIRAATSADIPGIIALARASDTAAQWTDRQYHELLSEARLVLVVLSETEDASHAPSEVLLIGFLVARRVDREWELENIVVAESAQRKGIGTALMNALFNAASEPDSEAVFLEVRESNKGARALYERSGFESVGRRKSYYAQPLEDAILYRFRLH
jgi:ribosomal-protein-alanine N-acetyltransferase